MESPLDLSDRESSLSSGADSPCSSDNEADRHCQAEGSSGMADVIAKMLGKKTTENQPVILAKRKTKHIAEFKAEAKKKKRALAAHRDWEEQQHVIPPLARNDLERRLHSIATKGVVKLFNAVSKQQKEIKAKLDDAPTEAKREKVVSSISQDNFLEMLRGGNSMVTGPIARKKSTVETASAEKEMKPSSKSKKVEKENEPTEGAPWRVLQDNFLMDAKMKDWDRANSSSDEDSVTGGVEESSDEET